MALEFKPKDGRLLAVIMLAIVLLLVYLGGVHWWFVSPHLQYFDQMSELRDQQLRFRRIVGEQSELDRRAAEVAGYERDNQAFLPEADINAASANLIQRVKQAVTAHAPDANRCQVVSTQPYAGGEEELYKRVTIQIRMRCDMEQLLSISYDLESGKPYLFVDQVMVYRQQVYVPPGGKKVAPPPLDIRFNLTGYVRLPGKVEK